MKRILLIFSVICSVLVTAKAQVSVNYDQKTVAAMAGAYATETAAEAYCRDWKLSGIDKSLPFAQKVNQTGHVLNLKSKN